MNKQAPLPAPTDRAMEIVLEVNDLEASARFYRDTLGMPEIERWPAERPALWVKAATGTYLGLWTPQAGGPGVGIHGSQVPVRSTQTKLALRARIEPPPEEAIHGHHDHAHHRDAEHHPREVTGAGGVSNVGAEPGSTEVCRAPIRHLGNDAGIP